jgi:hypothetical protein
MTSAMSSPSTVDKTGNEEVSPTRGEKQPVGSFRYGYSRSVKTNEEMRVVLMEITFIYKKMESTFKLCYGII